MSSLPKNVLPSFKKIYRLAFCVFIVGGNAGIGIISECLVQFKYQQTGS